MKKKYLYVLYSLCLQLIFYVMEKFLQKYWNIIKEEVNVKEVDNIKSDMNIKKIVKPIGSVISSRFGRDVGLIIKHAKQWDVVFLDNNQIEVNWWSSNWILEDGDYQIVYEGLDGEHMLAEDNVIVDLNLKLDDQLIEEWLMRELSRALNQMRKEADYSLDARVNLYIDSSYNDTIKKYEQFLKDEALLSNIIYEKNDDIDITQEIELWDKKVICSLSGKH